MFLLQASASLAVAVLLLVGAPPVLRLAAAGLAFGALAGFVGSRTVGVFGFTERGLQPSPQALLSIVVEACTLLLLLGPIAIRCSDGAEKEFSPLVAGSENGVRP